MREVLSVSVDKKLKRKLNNASKRFKISRSELVKLAVEKYITHEDFRELRALLIPYAERAKCFTDEDIFEDIS